MGWTAPFYSDEFTVKGLQTVDLSLPVYEGATVVDGSEPIDMYVTATGSGPITVEDTTATGTKTLGPIATHDEDGSGFYAVSLSASLAKGWHRLTAHSLGSADYWPNASTPLEVTVSADHRTTVEASPSYTTFYPYKDDYRDTVAIRGDAHGEVAKAIVRIYSPTGRLVRTLSAGNAVKWSIPWNGRNGAGSRVPAGRYKVVLSGRDLAGNTDRVAFYVRISNKRVTWYTGTVTKGAGSYSDSGDSEGTYDEYGYGECYDEYGNYVECDYYDDAWITDRPNDTVTLVGGTHDEEYAWTGYRFRVPTADVYKLTFRVLGAPTDGGGPAYLSMWNYRSDTDDAVTWASNGYAWSSTTTDSNAHVQNGNVWGYLTAVGWNQGTFAAAKVQLTYRYGMLK